MKALLCTDWGDPSTLTITDVEPAPLGHTDVRVAIHAAGVNFLDTLMVAGQYQVKPPLPFSPGVEIGGRVVEVGPGVHGISPGDRVMGLLDYGGFAEETVVDYRMLMPIPDDMDYQTAAAFPIAYGTSHLALSHRARLQPGETLLVFGAAGGVGLTAVEIGRAMGATVIACASTDAKLKLAEHYGASYAINYTEESIRERVKTITGGKGADVIYDPVGGDAFKEAIRCINWEGRLLVIGFASGDIPQLPANLALVKNFSLVGVYWGAYSQRNPTVLFESLQTLLSWYEAGTLRPYISKTYPLERAAEAKPHES